jgi:hypothetical protein
VSSGDTPPAIVVPRTFRHELWTTPCPAARELVSVPAHRVFPADCASLAPTPPVVQGGLPFSAC